MGSPKRTVFNEKYLLNLSLDYMRRLGITHHLLLEDQRTGRYKTPREFYRFARFYTSANQLHTLQDLVGMMNPCTRGFIMSLGAQEETAYRRLMFQETMDIETLQTVNTGGSMVLTKYATAVITGCMWEILVTERLCIYGPQSGEYACVHIPAPKMLGFVMKNCAPIVASKKETTEVTVDVA